MIENLPDFFKIVILKIQIQVQRSCTHVRFSSCSSRTLEAGLSSCGTQAWLLHVVWNLPRPGTEPVFPPLAGRSLPTEPPEKSPVTISSLLGFPGCKSECNSAGKLLLPGLIQFFDSLIHIRVVVLRVNFFFFSSNDTLYI